MATNSEDAEQFESFNDLANSAVDKNEEQEATSTSTGGNGRNVITINLRSQNNDWRGGMDDHDDDSTDSEEDEYTARMFQSGRVMVTQLPDTVNVTRIPASKDLVQKRRELLARRREEVRNMDRSQLDRAKTTGKRKFEERMTLQEAKLTDFEDSKDYVDFLQSKLQGVNIKIVK